MIADTEAELHAMAVRIGVPPRAHHGDHYDIARSKRTMALRAGAREVTQRQLAAMLWLWHNGQAMGEPQTAVERMTAARAALGRAVRGRHDYDRRARA